MSTKTPNRPIKKTTGVDPNEWTYIGRSPSWPDLQNYIEWSYTQRTRTHNHRTESRGGPPSIESDRGNLPSLILRWKPTLFTVLVLRLPAHIFLLSLDLVTPVQNVKWHRLLYLPQGWEYIERQIIVVSHYCQVWTSRGCYVTRSVTRFSKYS